MPDNSADFRNKVQSLASPLAESQVRKCYGVSNCAKFVTGGFLCGIPNIDNLDKSTGALCVFSKIQLSPSSELHTALLLRKEFPALIKSLEQMVSKASAGFFADKNNNCALFLASDGCIYPYNKAKETFDLTPDVLKQLGPGVEPDALYWAVYGNESDAQGSSVAQLGALVGPDKFQRISLSDTGEADEDWNDAEWSLSILIYNRHVIPKGLTRPQADFSRRLVRATNRSAGSWDRRIANIRFALTGKGLSGGGKTPEIARHWQSQFETSPDSVVALAAHALKRNDDGTAICKELGIPEPLLPEPQPGSSTHGHFTALDSNAFAEACKAIGFNTAPTVIPSFIKALLTKPFVILTGNSGTGKTKLGELFAQWLCGTETTRFALVPVGADWTDNRNVLGFVNHIRTTKLTEQGATKDLPIYQSTRILDLLLAARQTPDKPFFLILDEMNLSHVERYFADFLSTLESKNGELLLHREGCQLPRVHSGPASVPESLTLPRNLFVIGTVNVDETTYMFSPKVLDRANVIEFRMAEDAPEHFLKSGAKPIGDITPAPAGSAQAFLSLSYRARGLHGTALLLHADPEHPPAGTAAALQAWRQVITDIFTLMRQTHQEFGFRPMAEMSRYLAVDYELAPQKEKWGWQPAADAQILQKVLPKLHGSRKRIEPLLVALARFTEIGKPHSDKATYKSNFDAQPIARLQPTDKAAFPASYSKLCDMIDAVRRDQFVSFIQ